MGIQSFWKSDFECRPCCDFGFYCIKVVSPPPSAFWLTSQDRNFRPSLNRWRQLHDKLTKHGKRRGLAVSKRSLTFSSKLNCFYFLINYRVNGEIMAFTHLEQFTYVDWVLLRNEAKNDWLLISFIAGPLGCLRYFNTLRLNYYSWNWLSIYSNWWLDYRK